MFCKHCGNKVSEKLKFCNGCGERLFEETDVDGMPGKMLDNILTALFLIVMFGLGILVGLVAVLLGSDVKPEVVTIISIVYLAAIFGICFSLARQVPKLIDAKLRTTSSSFDFMANPQLERRTTAQLDEYREPAMSVTDHTTRTLDKAPVRNT
jgi:hypothetical protein